MNMNTESYSQKIKLSQLTFGKSIAEDEIDLLNNYWVSTPTYIQAKNDNLRKVIYIGHRGSGKSALFNRLHYEYGKSNKIILLEIKPADYSYEIFHKVKHDFYNMKTIYGIVWHYTLLIIAFRNVLRFFHANKHIKKHKKNIEIITRYLENNGLLTSEKGLYTFFKFLEKFNIAKVGIKIVGFEIDTKTKKEDYKLLKLLNMEDILRPYNAFTEILSTYPLYIFIDELDTGWDNSKEAQNFIYGLIYAVNKLRRERNINIFLSLRQDMYNNLPQLYPDAEKLHDIIQIITWKSNNLKALIGYRLLNFLPREISKSLAYKECIDLIFEEGALDYIINHTLFRPREIIQYCNNTLDSLRASPFGDEYFNKISMELVKEENYHFSNYRLNEVCEEYSKQFQNIKELLHLFESCEVYYTAKEFETKLEECILLLLDRGFNDSWLNRCLSRPDELLRILFDIGFIKIYVERYEKYCAYYELTFYYIKNIEKIRIHEIFCSALKLSNS